MPTATLADIDTTAPAQQGMATIADLHPSELAKLGRFVPPPLSSHQGPDPAWKSAEDTFTPPPLSSHAGVDPRWQPVPEDQPTQASNWAVDPVIGAFKGAASTLFHAGDLIRRGEQSVKGALPKQVQDWLDSAPQGVKDFVGYGNKPLDNPEVQQGITPTNTPQKLGFGAEQIGEYAVPGLDAEKGASLLTKAALSGTKAALVRGAQTGGDAGQMAAAGATGAAFPVAGAVVGKAGSAIKSAVAAGNLPKVPEGVIDIGHVANLIPGVNAIGGPLTAAARFWNRAADWIGKTRPASTSPAVVNQPPGGDWEGYFKMISALRGQAESAGASETTLDGIAQSLAGKSFSKLNAQDQASVKTIASRLVEKPTVAPAESTASAPTQVAGAGSGTSNPYEANARSQKAQALARFLYLGGQGIKTEDALMMNPQHWRLAAEGAGTTNPSPATTKQAITELQKLWDAHVAAQQLSDSMTPPGAPLQ